MLLFPNTIFVTHRSLSIAHKRITFKGIALNLVSTFFQTDTFRIIETGFAFRNLVLSNPPGVKNFLIQSAIIDVADHFVLGVILAGT
jgi:hypothetical protein